MERSFGIFKLHLGVPMQMGETLLIIDLVCRVNKTSCNLIK